MRWNLVLLITVAGLAAVSCNQGSSAPSSLTSTTPSATPANSPSGLNIPKDAQWTIFCTMFSDPDHVRQAKLYRDQLAQSTELKEWYIVQGEGRTTLYYGFYRAIDQRSSIEADRKEAARANNDRKAIAALSDPQSGQKIFRNVVLVPLDSSDPAAPPEWNLASARTKGVYTLQIGVYKDSAQRKEAAVEAVREARAAGIEAYFYHGPSASSVCIGAWPESAVVKKTPRPQLSPQEMAKLSPQYRQILEDPNYAHTTDPNEVLLLVPGSLPVPQGQFKTPDGKPVHVVQPKAEIVDQSLRATMKQFPNHSVNGVESWETLDPKTGKKRLTKKPSVLVRIPEDAVVRQPGRTSRSQPDPIRPQDPRPGAVETPATPEQPAPVRPPTSTNGRLRSIEDK